MYFSYSPIDGMLFHKTEEEAKKEAEDSIQQYLNEQWDEEVEEVCWGIINEFATKTNVRDDPSGDFDYLCDYELQKVL